MTEFAQLTKSDTHFLIVCLVAFFLIPYLPRWVLVLTDNFLLRLAILVGLIGAAYKSPIHAIAAFIVIAFLFIERNKVKLHQLKAVMTMSNGPDSEAVAGIQTPSTAPFQPAFDVAPSGSIPFMPDAETGSDSFAPVAPTMDRKQPLPTESANGSHEAIQQLFEWVHPAVVNE